MDPTPLSSCPQNATARVICGRLKLSSWYVLAFPGERGTRVGVAARAVFYAHTLRLSALLARLVVPVLRLLPPA